MIKTADVCPHGGDHNLMSCNHADGKGHPTRGPQGCHTTTVVDSHGVEWTHEELGGLDYIEHKGGVSWFEAAPPPYKHKCQPQTVALLKTDVIHRCACGAISLDGRRPDEHWMERNQRVATLTPNDSGHTERAAALYRAVEKLEVAKRRRQSTAASMSGLVALLVGEAVGLAVCAVVLGVICYTVPLDWYVQGFLAATLGGIAVIVGGVLGFGLWDRRDTP